MQARQQQHRVITDAAPHRDDGYGDYSGLGVGNPLDISAQNLVEDAVLAVENPAPHHGHGGGGADQGQEEQGAEAALELHLGVEQDGHKEGQRHAHGHGEDTEEDGVPGGLPELDVPEHLDVVPQADELVMAEALMLTEAGVDGLDKGPDIQHHQTNDGRRHHEPAPVLLPPGGGGQFHVHREPSFQLSANFLAVSVSMIFCMLSRALSRLCWPL